MNLERFFHKEWGEKLGCLMKVRNMDEKLVDEVPSYGVIATQCGKLVCAGFLRSVEGNFGMIDGLITDPSSSSAERHEAINLVVSSLIEAAKEFRMSVVMAFTIDDTVMARSGLYKFESMPHKLMKLSLEGEK